MTALRSDFALPSALARPAPSPPAAAAPASAHTVPPRSCPGRQRAAVCADHRLQHAPKASVLKLAGLGIPLLLGHAWRFDDAQRGAPHAPALEASSLSAATSRPALPASRLPMPKARRALAGASLAHALHDGYTDMIYILLPVWQAEFGLGYGALAALRGLYAGTMAVLQVPSGRLAELVGSRAVLVAGTLLAALGYALAGLSGGLLGLCAALALSGAGSSTQHPLASAAVSRAYGGAARGPLGTYNFAGDLGKAALPALTALLLALMPWRPALWLLALLGLLAAIAVHLLVPAFPRVSVAATAPKRTGGARPRRLQPAARHRRARQRRAHGLPDLPALPAPGERRGAAACGPRLHAALPGRRRGQVRLRLARGALRHARHGAGHRVRHGDGHPGGAGAAAIARAVLAAPARDHVERHLFRALRHGAGAGAARPRGARLRRVLHRHRRLRRPRARAVRPPRRPGRAGMGAAAAAGTALLTCPLALLLAPKLRTR